MDFQMFVYIMIPCPLTHTEDIHRSHGSHQHTNYFLQGDIVEMHFVLAWWECCPIKRLGEKENQLCSILESSTSKCVISGLDDLCLKISTKIHCSSSHEPEWWKILVFYFRERNALCFYFTFQPLAKEKSFLLKFCHLLHSGEQNKRLSFLLLLSFLKEERDCYSNDSED